jgi:hypothetical protein
MVKKNPKKSLKSVLHKLGIKSAGVPTMEEVLEDLQETLIAGFGQPDQIFMAPSVLEAFMKQFGEDDK